MHRLLAILCVATIGLGAAPATAQPADCPPGLAKKDPPCIPPGQVGKRGGLERGDRFDRDYSRLRDPQAYDLPAIGTAEGYYVDGRVVYRVDEDTRRVLDIIRLADTLFGN